jgi:hypothetical protein
MNAMLVQLQLTGTRNLVAHVQENNNRSFNFLRLYGGEAVSAPSLNAVSPDGVPTQFGTMIIPVEGRLRNACLRMQIPATPEWGKLTSRAETSSSGGRRTTLATMYGGVSFDDAVAHLSGASEKVAIVLTGGCANMSIEDSEHLMAYFREAFAGLNFAFVSGGTRMQFAAGQEITDTVVPSITEVLPAIAPSLGPQARILGVVAVDEVRPTENRRVEYGVQKQHVTVVNSDFSELHFVTNNEYGEGCNGQWHTEARRRLDLVDELKKRGFNVITVLYNGGDVSRWEIAKQTSHPVIRIVGSGRVADDNRLTTLDGRPTTAVAIGAPYLLRSKILSLAGVPENLLVAEG